MDELVAAHPDAVHPPGAGLAGRSRDEVADPLQRSAAGSARRTHHWRDMVLCVAGRA